MSATKAAAPSSYSDLAAVIESLPLLVREARRARGLSVRAAAAQVGCSFSTISRFENGDDVNLSNAAEPGRLDDPSRTSNEQEQAMTALRGRTATPTSDPEVSR